MNNQINLTPSYNDIHNMCYSIVGTLKQREMKFDLIVGLARGGLIPATLISHMTGLPMLSAHYSSKRGNGDDKDHSNTLPYVPQNKLILLVDDICDSGWTLREVVDQYEHRGNGIYTAVLFYKAISTPPIVPMIRCQTIPADSGWCTFPWEVQGTILN